MDLKSIEDMKPKNKKPSGKSSRRNIDRDRTSKKPDGLQISTRPIASLLIGLGVLSVILLVTMLTAVDTPSNAAKTVIAPSETGPQQAEVTTTPIGEEVLGVLTEVNLDTRELVLYDVVNEMSSTYTYTGGTNITDKYGQLLAISQIPIGTMLEVFHKPGQLKLSDIRISTKAWEYVGVNNLNIDRSARVMKIANNKFKYTDNIIILDGENFIPVTNLAEQDELTVWGYDQTIWSITVTRGHGTVRLTDDDNYLGDFITIGYEAIKQIAKNMVITVREGNFNLTVENSKYTATKNITVLRNKETLVSLSGLGPDAAKVGRVTFEITPFGADLFIDGELTSYANPVEIDYGQHNLEVSLDGYTTYIGTLKVEAAGKTLRIDLPEKSSKQGASVSETNSGAEEQNNDNPNNSSVPEETSDNTDNNDVPKSIDTGDTENVSNDEFEEDNSHKIYIQNPVGASVYLNGEYMCKSPGSFNKLIGTHVLTFIKEGYETVSYTVEVKDDNLDTYFNMPDLSKKK